MDDHIKVWYDPEGDYLEVAFQKKAGTFRETSLDQVMAKVDSNGKVIGFSILKMSTLKGNPLELSLASATKVAPITNLAELARQTGVSRSTLYRLLAGKTKSPRGVTLAKLRSAGSLPKELAGLVIPISVGTRRQQAS